MNLDKCRIMLEVAVQRVSEGCDVPVPAGGNSMLPFIRNGEKIVLTNPDKIEVGKVYLAWVDDCRFVAHRIESINGDCIKLMGDGNLVYGEYCGFDNIKARIDYVISKNGKKRFLYTSMRRFLLRIWIVLKPVRKYLLIIYHKLEKR